MSRARNLWWRIMDPVLLRVASRLAHLSENHPRRLSTERWRDCAEADPHVAFLDEARIVNCGDRAALSIGDFTHVAGELAIVAPGGRLRVGRYCFVGPGTRVWAQTAITIGDHVLIAHLVDIHDTDSHSTNVVRRRADPVDLFERGAPIAWENVQSSPVVIEDDVWIGFKSSILKGVTIGRGAIVAAGAVVTKDVPAYTLVAGNPARVVRQLEREGA
jgi:acetyltransferase-like isoleucine patch superfamily enzyme